MASPSIGLVLSAGGDPGRAYHAGVLAALRSITGWDARRADLIVGTSAGASAAAHLRAGLSPDDDLARFVGRPLSDEGAALLRRVVDRRGADAPPPRGRPRPLRPSLALRALWGTTPPVVGLAGLAPRSVVPNDDLGRRVRRVTGSRWPEAPLWICAVRVRDGRRVVFGRDDVVTPDPATAVQASCAVPWSVAPVGVGSTTYMDGALHSPTNADLVARLAFDLVIVVSAMSSVPRTARCSRARGPVVPWASRRLRREVEAIRARGSEVLVVQPTASERILRRTGADQAEVADAAAAATRTNLGRPSATRARALLTAAAFAAPAGAR